MISGMGTVSERIVNTYGIKTICLHSGIKEGIDSDLVPLI